MLKRVVLLSVLTAVGAVFSVSALAAEVAELKTQKQKLSYIIGLRLGRGAMGSGMDLDARAVAQAVEDVIGGTAPRLTQEQMIASVKAFEKEEKARQQAKSEANRKRGEAFLSKNASRDGVTVTSTGLQYEVVKQGTGAKPKASDKVKVHYRGTLVDGTEFDSSYSRGEPVTLALNGVIQAWREALPLMPVGSTWKIFVPAKLGYGSRGAGDRIGPDEVLIFDIELLEAIPQG